MNDIFKTLRIKNDKIPQTSKYQQISLLLHTNNYSVWLVYTPFKYRYTLMHTNIWISFKCVYKKLTCSAARRAKGDSEFDVDDVIPPFEDDDVAIRVSPDACKRKWRRDMGDLVKQLILFI